MQDSLGDAVVAAEHDAQADDRERERFRELCRAAHELDQEQFVLFVLSCAAEVEQGDVEQFVLEAMNVWWSAHFTCVPVDQVTPDERRSRQERFERYQHGFRRIASQIAPRSILRPLRPRNSQRVRRHRPRRVRRATSTSASRGDPGGGDGEPRPPRVNRRAVSSILRRTARPNSRSIIRRAVIA